MDYRRTKLNYLNIIHIHTIHIFICYKERSKDTLDG